MKRETKKRLGVIENDSSGEVRRKRGIHYAAVVTAILILTSTFGQAAEAGSSSRLTQTRTALEKWVDAGLVVKRVEKVKGPEITIPSDGNTPPNYMEEVNTPWRPVSI